ncbi:MAG: hypothetical protein ACX932_02125 [Gammaproteobacteria bacterium]
MKTILAKIFSLGKEKDKDHELQYYPARAPFIDVKAIKNEKDYLNSFHFPHHMAVAYVHLHPEFYTQSYNEAKSKKKSNKELYRALNFDDAVERVYKVLMREHIAAEKAKKSRKQQTILKPFTKEVQTAIKENAFFLNHLEALTKRRTNNFQQLDSQYIASRTNSEAYYAEQKNKKECHEQAWLERTKNPASTFEEATSYFSDDATITMTNTLDELNTYQMQQARRATLLPFTDSTQSAAWNLLKSEHEKVIQSDKQVTDASNLLNEQEELLTKHGYFSEASSAADLIEYAQYINESIAFAEAIKKDLPEVTSTTKNNAQGQRIKETLQPFVQGVLNKQHHFDNTRWACQQIHSYIEEGELARMGRVLSMQILAYLREVYSDKDENKENDVFHHFFNKINDETVKGFTNAISILNQSEDYDFDLKFLSEEERIFRSKPTYLELQQLLRFVRSYLPKDIETQDIFFDVLNVILNQERQAFTPVKFVQKIDPQLLAVHTVNSAAIVKEECDGDKRRSPHEQRKAKIKDTTFGDEEPGYKPVRYRDRILSPIYSLFSLLNPFKIKARLGKYFFSEKEDKNSEKKPAPRSPQLSKVEGITSARQLTKVLAKSAKGTGNPPHYKLLPHTVRPYRKRRLAIFMPFSFDQDTEYDYIGFGEMLRSIKHWFGRWCYAMRGRPYYERTEPVTLSLAVLLPQVLKGNIFTGQVKGEKPGWWRHWLGGEKIWEFFQTADNVDTAAVIWSAYLHIKKALGANTTHYRGNEEYTLSQLAKQLDFNTFFDFVTLVKQTQNELRLEREKAGLLSIRAKFYFKRYEKTLDKLMRDSDVLDKAVVMAQHIVEDMDESLRKIDNVTNNLTRYPVSSKDFNRYEAFFELVKREYIPAAKKQRSKKQKRSIEANIAKFEKLNAEFNKKRSVVYYIEQIVKNKEHWKDKNFNQDNYGYLPLDNYTEAPLHQLLQMIELYTPDSQKPIGRALVNFLLGTYRPKNGKDYHTFIKNVEKLFKANPKKKELTSNEKIAAKNFFKLLAENFIVPHVDEVNSNEDELLTQNTWLLSKYSYEFVKNCFEKKTCRGLEKWRESRAELVQVRYNKIVQFLNSSAVIDTTHPYSDADYHEQLTRFNQDIAFIERYGDDNGCLASLKTHIWRDVLFASKYPVAKGALYAALQKNLQPNSCNLDKETIQHCIKSNEKQKNKFEALLTSLEDDEATIYDKTGSSDPIEGGMERIIKFTRKLCNKSEMARTTLQERLMIVEKFFNAETIFPEELDAIESSALVYGAGEKESEALIATCYRSIIEKKEDLKNKKYQLDDANLLGKDTREYQDDIANIKNILNGHYHILAEEVLLYDLKRYFQLPYASLSLEAAYGACRFDYYTLNQKISGDLKEEEIHFFRAQQNNKILRYLVKDKLVALVEQAEENFNPLWLTAAPLVGAFENDEELARYFIRLIDELDFSTLYDNDNAPTPIMEKIVKGINNSNNEIIIARFGQRWSHYLLQRQQIRVKENGKDNNDPQVEGERAFLARNFFKENNENKMLAHAIKIQYQTLYPSLIADNVDNNYYRHNNNYRVGTLAHLALWMGGDVQGYYAKKAMMTLLQGYACAKKDGKSFEDLQITQDGDIHMASRYSNHMQTDVPEVQQNIDEALIKFMQLPQSKQIPMDFFFLLVEKYGGNKAHVHYHLAMMKRIVTEKNHCKAESLFNAYQEIINTRAKISDGSIFQRLDIELDSSLEEKIIQAMTEVVNTLGISAQAVEGNAPLWTGVKEAMIYTLLPSALKENESVQQVLQQLYRAWFYRVSYGYDKVSLSEKDNVFHKINAEKNQSETLLKLIGDNNQNVFLQDIIYFLDHNPTLILNEALHGFFKKLCNDPIWIDKSAKKNCYNATLTMRQEERKVADSFKQPPFSDATEALKTLIAKNNSRLYQCAIERIRDYILNRYRELNEQYVGDDHQKTVLDQFVAAINSTNCQQLTVPLEAAFEKIKQETEEKEGGIKKARELNTYLALVDNYKHIATLKTHYMPDADEHDVGELSEERENYWKQKRQNLYNYIAQNISDDCLPSSLRQEVQSLVQGYQSFEGGVKSTYQYPAKGSQLKILTGAKNQRDAEGLTMGYLQHSEHAYVRVLQQVVLPSLKKQLPHWEDIELTVDNGRICANYLSINERHMFLERISNAAEYLSIKDPLREVLESFVVIVKQEAKRLQKEKNKEDFSAADEEKQNKATVVLLRYNQAINTPEEKKAYFETATNELCVEIENVLDGSVENQKNAVREFFDTNTQRYFLRLLQEGYGSDDAKIVQLFETMGSFIEKIITFLLSEAANGEKKADLIVIMGKLMDFYNVLGELPNLTDKKKNFAAEKIELNDGNSFSRSELLIAMIKNITESSLSTYNVEQYPHILYNLYHLLKIIAPEASNKADTLLLTLFHGYVNSFSNPQYQQSAKSLSLENMESLLVAVWPNKMASFVAFRKTEEKHLTQKAIDKQCSLLANQGLAKKDVDNVRFTLESQLPEKLRANVLSDVEQQAIQRGEKDGITFTSIEYEKAISELKEQLFEDLVSTLNIRSADNYVERIEKYKQDVKTILSDIVRQLRQYSKKKKLEKFSINSESVFSMLLENSLQYQSEDDRGQCVSKPIPPAILMGIGLIGVCTDKDKLEHGDWIKEGKYGAQTLNAYLAMLYEIEKHKSAIVKGKSHLKARQHMQVIVMKVLRLGNQLNVNVLKNNYLASHEKSTFLFIDTAKERNDCHVFFKYIYDNIKSFMNKNVYKDYFEKLNLDLKQDFIAYTTAGERSFSGNVNKSFISISKQNSKALGQGIRYFIKQIGLEEPNVSIYTVQKQLDSEGNEDSFSDTSSEDGFAVSMSDTDSVVSDSEFPEKNANLELDEMMANDDAESVIDNKKFVEATKMPFQADLYGQLIEDIKRALFDALVISIGINSSDKEQRLNGAYLESTYAMFNTLYLQTAHYCRENEIGDKKIFEPFFHIRKMLQATKGKLLDGEQGLINDNSDGGGFLRAFGLRQGNYIQPKNTLVKHSQWVNTGNYEQIALVAYFAALYAIDMEAKILFQEKDLVGAQERIQRMLAQIMRFAHSADEFTFDKLGPAIRPEKTKVQHLFLKHSFINMQALLKKEHYSEAIGELPELLKPIQEDSFEHYSFNDIEKTAAAWSQKTTEKKKAYRGLVLNSDLTQASWKVDSAIKRQSEGSAQSYYFGTASVVDIAAESNREQADCSPQNTYVA